MAVFTIPPGESFVDALAGGLLREAKGDPSALSAMLILLPTRRACRALREAFLRASQGRPLLLPRLKPLGEADEDELPAGDDGEIDLPPAIPPLTRQLLLARLIAGLGGGRGGRPPTFAQAARLAGELGRLLDQVHTEGLDFGRLAALVPDEYAAHWQITLEFLAILTEHWPRILAEGGWMDGAERRNRVLDGQAAAWRSRPPEFPVIAAGSTGSIPATARLLAVVADLPNGRLVLPGLDRHLDAVGRTAVDHSHPQYGLLRLLDHLGLAPEQVEEWPGCRESRRARLASAMMRPAAVTDSWRRLPFRPAADDLAGLARIDCPGPRHEAGVIALLLRQALEEEGRTAALVTADRGLARRVAAELDRFGIDIDDSAGRPLNLTPPGAYLLLTAAMVGQAFAPHAVLAALKHPLAAGGLPPGQFRRRVRQLERIALRGPRPAPGVAGLSAAIGGSHPLAGWLTRLADLAQPFADLLAQAPTPLGTLLAAHVAFAERLADDGQSDGARRLWHGEAGDAAAGFVADLKAAADGVPPLDGRDYGELLHTLMAPVAVRPAYGRHPRLAIWGPLEARLQHADRLVVGGLNEGSWPPEVAADPWMSRPMRLAFGLPPAERRIGLAAHDFAQAFCAPQVVLTRSARVEGTPAVPSRWLLRLDAVLAAGGLPDGAKALAPVDDWLAWHAALERPAGAEPGRAPEPRPPVAARPRRLWATAIETLMRDPYAVYARHVLGLEALPPIDADPGAADYGSIVHAALDAFLKAHRQGPLPADSLERLRQLGRASFARTLARPGVWAFWWPRFERVAAWFVAHETARRAGLSETWSEVEGELSFAAPAGAFTLLARADRIDRLADGTLAVIDYKTGAAPSAKEVAAGFAPQLPIEAAIAQRGGFPGIPGRPVGQLLYWRLKGGLPAGEERAAGDDPGRLAGQALAGVERLVGTFDDPQTPYRARPHPDKAPKYSDYLHLARVKEWAGGDDEEDD